MKESDKTLLKKAIGKRIERAGKPASNLNYTTMQLIMAEAARMAEKRNRRAKFAAIATWIMMAAFGIYTIVKVCGESLLNGYGSIAETLTNPAAWNTPSTHATIALGLVGLVIIVGNCIFGPLYDKLMIRELAKHCNNKEQ